MSDTKFAAWTVAESPITIEYSMIVIEEIRHAVAEGFQRLSRGGIEVGGILYGAREGRTVRVLAMRPIACEHARGPAFLLSDKDRMGLNQQLTSDAEDPHLEGLISVGWFLSHTRSEITLSDSDLELYSIFFPAPWQVTLVVRPGRAGSMRAGFFVREADGTVKSESSYLEFNFPDRLAGVLDRAPAPPRAERDRVQGERRLNVMPRAEAFQSSAGAVAAARREILPPREIPAPTFGQPTQYVPSPPPRKKWPWLVGWAVLVILAAVFGLRYWMLKPTQEPISLAVIEHDGQLRIEWNHSARPVTAAVHGTLVINDGSGTQTYALSPRELTAGSYTYQRKTGDVEVRMSVEDSEGTKVQEASRFLGQAPVTVDQNELGDLKKKREDLEAEVQRLTRANRAQEEKIQQLQRTVQIMQARSAK
jgi:chaperonin cofactor prefoldin/proteasome lid subunit RPN8/RPN11